MINQTPFLREYSLSDKAIGHLAKLVQLAILSGTDIVDNMRMMKLVVENNELTLSKEYDDRVNDHIESMLNEIQTMRENDEGQG
jgi:hypothetical protein